MADSPPTAAGTLAERLAVVFAATLERFARVGAVAGDPAELRMRKGLLLLVSVSLLPLSLVWGSLYLVLGSAVGFAPYLYFVISFAAILIFRRTRDFGSLLRIEELDILLATTLSAIPLGGFAGSGGVGLWGILAPLGALVFAGLESAARWFVTFLAFFLGAGLIGELFGGGFETPDWFNSAMVGLNVAASSVIVFMLLAVFVQQRQAALAALRVEQEKAEELLLNVLPRSIADRLRSEPQTIADQIDSASILFADVVDFTPFAQRLPATQVVEFLDGLFARFDALAERHGLEKIKTIGDCYMVAAGVPNARPDHAAALARMALDMLDVMRANDELGRLGLELRIGINSGPVVAGVIGRKRFLYDLWGDAVNTASRMESHGTPGQIQITGATHELIEHDFVCQRRGMVEIKGKGQMETWYLTAARAA